MASQVESSTPLLHATQAPSQTGSLVPATAEIRSDFTAEIVSSNADNAAQIYPLPGTERILDLLQTGGPVVWILLGFSIVALSILLIKVWQLLLLQPERTTDVSMALNHWRKRDTETALTCLKTHRPISALVATAMSHRNHLNPELLQEELSRLAQKHLNQLRSLLRPLEVIATLSPLLGLLGTVLGMITAFQQMEAAGSQVDPATLSGGIWQALLTTAVGLSVAIPVLIVHAWLERKNERVAARMNDAVTQVFTCEQTTSKTGSGDIKRVA
ncbi:MotA/TolQ/ExbB proton channel family protein [Pontibacter sp. JAM-7]|uniref:MotA/TolQ/ExbB proton channel family protein n=1 Tax=Pontibacter sp. JAM-7 TaxID=3366581 RepID=UPI003AF446C7